MLFLSLIMQICSLLDTSPSLVLKSSRNYSWFSVWAVFVLASYLYFDLSSVGLFLPVLRNVHAIYVFKKSRFCSANLSLNLNPFCCFLEKMHSCSDHFVWYKPQSPNVATGRNSTMSSAVCPKSDLVKMCDRILYSFSHVIFLGLYLLDSSMPAWSLKSS